jgi:hypothetical protein
MIGEYLQVFYFLAYTRLSTAKTYMRRTKVDFDRAKDKRGMPMQGLWLRKRVYYGQIRVTNPKTGRRIPQIVLPQGRFNNTSDKPIREFIAQHACILAVVGLHGNTFKPHIGTKTSVLFLQKWNEHPDAGPLCPRRKDYPIFFATSQASGKDTSGEYVYLSDDKGRRLYDLHAHPMVDHDLFNLRAALAAQRDQRLSAARTERERAAIRVAHEEKMPFVPDRPGIADAFREWGRKQGFAFCEEDPEQWPCGA